MCANKVPETCRSAYPPASDCFVVVCPTVNKTPIRALIFKKGMEEMWHYTLLIWLTAQAYPKDSNSTTDGRGGSGIPMRRPQRRARGQTRGLGTVPTLELAKTTRRLCAAKSHGKHFPRKRCRGLSLSRPYKGDMEPILCLFSVSGQKKPFYFLQVGPRHGVVFGKRKFVQV